MSLMRVSDVCTHVRAYLDASNAGRYASLRLIWVVLNASAPPRVIVRARGALSPLYVFAPRRFEPLTEGSLPVSC